MPHTCRSRYRPGSAHLGGKRPSAPLVRKKDPVGSCHSGRGNRCLWPKIEVPYGAPTMRARLPASLPGRESVAGVRPAMILAPVGAREGRGERGRKRELCGVLKEVLWCLVAEGSISYRRIKLSFGLDHDGLEELRRE